MTTQQPRIYNSRVLDTYLKLIKARYPQVNIDALCRSLGVEPYEIADQGLWLTQAQVNRFYYAVVKATGNENIAREAGRYAASAEALGTLRQYILALFGPIKAFTMGNKLSETLTKSADYSSEILSGNSVEITVRLRDGVQEEPFQCENRIGVFEAIVAIFNFKPPVIEHEECIFKGDKVCRYVVRWQSNSTALIKQCRDLYAGIAAVVNVALAMTSPVHLEYVLPISVIGFLSINWGLEISRNKLGESTLEQLRNSTEQLNEQIDVNYRNTQLIREIGEALTSQNNIDAVIATVNRILEDTLDYDRGLILLANNKEKCLEIRGAFGYSEQHLDLLENTSFRLNNPNSQGPFVVSYREQKPLLVNDVNKISATVTPKSRQFIDALGTKSFLTVPIILEGESIGILAVDNQERKKPLVNSDLNLLMGIAPTIGISFRNAALNEARENQFTSTIKVLAHSIDARDFLTAGHSEKVAEYSVGIAVDLGLSHEYCQMIRIAALLHDYGKIGIPDTVLKKNGPLSDEERALIETHADKSHDILSQVPFEGIYQEIPKIALHHHERWDGTGYPNGLKATEIPLGARIIAVADFFEAITSLRHYRAPMPTVVATNLLKQESGKHFDEDIVNVFLWYLKRSNQFPEMADTEDAKAQKQRSLLELREPRCNFNTRVQVTINDMVVNGQTVDISASGAFLQLDRSLAEKIERNAAIDLVIDLPGAKNVNLASQVRWINLGLNNGSKRHPVGLGVAFTEIDQATKKILGRTVNKLILGKNMTYYPQLAAEK